MNISILTYTYDGKVGAMDFVAYACDCYDKWWPVTLPWSLVVVTLNLRSSPKQAIRVFSLDDVEARQIALLATCTSAIVGLPIALLWEVGHSQHVFVYWLIAMAVHFAVMKSKHPEFSNKSILLWAFKSNSLVWSFITSALIIVLIIAVALTGW